VVSVARAKGVVAGSRVEAIAVFHDESVARKELEAIAEGRSAAV
jgi:hypothetical protein